VGGLLREKPLLAAYDRQKAPVAMLLIEKNKPAIRDGLQVKGEHEELHNLRVDPPLLVRA
jgi:hypothetical protein